MRMGRCGLSSLSSGELRLIRRVACALPRTIVSLRSQSARGRSAGSAFSEGKYAERRCSAGGHHQGRDDHHTPSDTRTRGRSGLCQVFQPRRDRSVRRGGVGRQVGRHRQREGPGGLRAARRRDAPLLVAAGDQHRRLEIFPRTDRDAGARAQRQAAHRPRRRHDHGVGAQAELLRERRRPAGVQRRSEAPPRLSEGGVQQPRVVQRRVRESAAVLGLLHQRGAGHDGVDPRPGQDRGHALQVRIRHRLEPLEHPVVARAARRRRHGVGPGVLHEGLRRLRRRHQVGRQDAPRREDGDPQRRSSRHSGLHQLQGRGREEGLGAHRRRLRRIVHRSGLLVGVLPELEQQRARDRRVHARGDGRRGVAHAGGADRRGDGHLQGP